MLVRFVDKGLKLRVIDVRFCEAFVCFFIKIIGKDSYFVNRVNCVKTRCDN